MLWALFGVGMVVFGGGRGDVENSRREVWRHEDLGLEENLLRNIPMSPE